MESDASSDERPRERADVPSPATGRRRRPWLAALLSFLCVGVGQLYNGTPNRALALYGIFLSTETVALLITRLTPPGAAVVGGVLALLLAGLGLRVFAGVDAFRKSRRAGMSVLHRYQRGWVYGAAILAAIVGENMIARPLAGWKPYSTPSISMMPTIRMGEHFLAERGYFHRHIPRRGELAIFPLPRDRSLDFIKRIVGLPGDRIELRNGRLYVNATPLEWQRVEDVAMPRGVGTAKQFVEMQPDGARYRILQMTETGPIDNFPAVVVPIGHFFVLGDNRDNSADSRDAAIGFIAREDLSDRPYLIYWSATFSRIGTRLQ